MSFPCVAAPAVLAGCESLIPRDDLALMARTLPPSPAVTSEETQEIALRIRERTGVADFEFSMSEFDPEMKLPPGTGWLMGLFIVEPEDAEQ